MAMDKDVKDRWLTALRSGEYKQGQNYLERRGCNCCLGVLAKIEGVPMKDRYFDDMDNGEQDIEEQYGVFDFGDSFDEHTYPPDDWCGLSRDTIRKLATMNDDGKTFAEIADHIEEIL